MDAETFLDEMHAAHLGVWACLDLWASHAYPPGPFTAGPWVQIFQIDMLHDADNPNHLPPPPGMPNRGVNGYEWELFKLAGFGVPPLSVMVTEAGWRHAETVDPDTTDSGEHLPDAGTVAIFFDLALYGNYGRYPGWPETGWIPWAEDPRVVAVTPFALNGHPPEWGHTNWLEVGAEGKIVGTYAPFERWANGRPAQ